MTYDNYLSSQYQGETCKDGEAKVAKSIEAGRMFGVNGTPTFIAANGKRVSGFIPDQLRGIMQ
jgi:protein-disulfide isomerase